MKKLFIFSCFIALSLWCQAKVAYLLPNDCSYEATTGNLNGFVAESQNGVDQWPELNAAVWFRDNYVKVENPTGVFISGADFAANHSDITTLWVHIDRVGLSSDDCKAKMGGDTFVAALKSFVEAGGNVLVSKQATRLIGDVGRAGYPGYSDGGYDKSNEQWFIATHFANRSNTGHYIYHHHNGEISPDAPGNLESAWVKNEGYNTCADHNCGYASSDLGMSNNSDYENLAKYETDNACRVLGTWGGCTDMPYAGMMEFYPKGDYKGTIMMFGLATYMWITNNQGWGADHIRFITQSALEYLEGSAFWNEGRQPKDGIVGATDTETNRYGSNFGGYSVTAVSTNPAVADIERCTDCDHKGYIWYNGIGDATIIATYVGDGVNSCKTPIHIQQTIHVTGGNTNAQYLYLLHTPLNSVVEDDADKEEKPEIHAANWFYSEYVANNTGRFITAADIPTTEETAKGKVLWVHIDRKITKDAFDTFFGTDVINAVQAFAQNGGNVYLTGYAPRLAYKIGRAPEQKDAWWNISFGGYDNVDDNWLVTANMNGMEDRHTYGVYTQMAEGSYIEGYRYQMQHSEAKKRSNRNCLWEFGNATDLQAWEQANNAQTLGGWGHTPDVASAGIVEFFPTASFKGTIITNGLAACSFATSNNHVNHVKNLTKGALIYLGQTKPFDFTWVTAPRDSALASTQVVKIEHKANSTVQFQVLDPNASKASFGDVTISDEGDYATLTLNELGEDITIKVLREGDGKLVPKNVEYSIEKTIKVVLPEVKWEVEPGHAAVTEDKPEAQAVATSGTPVKYRSSDPTIASIDENTGKITYIKQGTCNITAYTTVKDEEYATEPFALTVNGLNVIWETEPAATAIVGGTMPAVAKVEYGSKDIQVQYQLTNCTYSEGALHFDTEGTAKVKPYATANDVTYYGPEKTITVTGNTFTYERATTAGKYGTICLERTSIAYTGATFYRPLFKTPSEGLVTSITLEEVIELTAGVGYFFLANANQVTVTMSLLEEALTEPIDDGTLTNGMHGTFEESITVPYTEGTANEMILSDNQLWYGKNNTVGEHRAWIKMNEVPGQEQTNPVPGRRRVSMVVNQPATPTAIDNAQHNPLAGKYIRNNRMYIVRKGATYNVLGDLMK